MADVVLLYTTWPDAETAESFAAEAIAERLCACANVLAPMRSVYRWQGAIDRAVETPMILKTSRVQAGGLRDLILARHPYETPCVVELSVSEAGSNAAFLDWIAAETAAAPSDA
jgi:periplasmic divalent cation tolerance protein